MDTAQYIEKIATLLGKILARTEQDTEVDGMDLTPSQLHTLQYLLRHGASSVGDIAQGLGISHPAAVKLIDRLDKKALAKRTESTTDRRVSIVELTEQGYETAERHLAKRTRILGRALSEMTTEELEDVMKGMEILLSAVLADRSIVESVCLHCGDDHIGCCIVNRAHYEVTGEIIEKH